MKNNAFSGDYIQKYSRCKQLFRSMKISTALLLVGALGSYAGNVHSQSAKVNLQMDQVSLNQILNEIESQTNYMFLYNNHVNVDRTTSIHAKDESVAKVLSIILEGTDIKYELAGEHIILTNRNAKTASAIVQKKTIKGKVIDGNDASAKDENLEKAFSEGNILAFNEKSIAFKEESTELKDKNNAKESLAYVISYMQKNPAFQLLICGTTTSAGEESSCIEFSENRAEAIRTLLVDEAGISSDKVHTIGCGWSSCLYVNDRGADGELNECAEQNRSVKLVDYNSQTAQEITDSLKTH